MDPDAVALVDTAECPAAVKVREVATFDEEGEPAGSRQVDAGYAWLLVEGPDGKGARHWLPADSLPLSILDPADEEEDQGEVVARLVKVNPLTGEIRYGHPTHPRHRCEVRQAAWQRMVEAGLVPALKAVERSR